MKTRIADVIAFILILLFLLGAIWMWNRCAEKNRMIDDLLVQQGKYEKLLDSTICYIDRKYGEFLPDTYWEGDIYCDLYEDGDCWDTHRNHLRNENKD